MRKRRQFFFPRRRWPRCKGRTIDDRSIEEYEQKKRTDVTKEMKNSTLKVNTRIRPVSCRSKWWYYRTVYTWNVMFEHSVFRFLYVRELLDRSNRSTCFCVLPTWGVPSFFFFLFSYFSSPWQNLINETLNRIEFAIVSPRCRDQHESRL